MDNRSDDQSRRGSHQDDSEDESEILEESPCGRWQKRKEEVDRCIPGIDATFLAMDMEEGVEVVWNEVNLVNWDLKQSKVREEKIKAALDQLIQLDHPNIVKLHKYWTDIRDEKKARVIFITEYMSSGSLKQFLVKTKRNVIKMALPAWKRWCTQLLSALCYMHSASPPIIHGNLSCDTICISHTGIIKIDAVAPNAIQRSLRWTRDDPPANLHFVAPEIGHCKDEVNCYVSPFPAPLTAAMDIYSFGICALEMAALEIPAAESNQVTQKIVLKTIDSLDNSLQKDFIKACISVLPSKRPSARKLLFHPVLFEVPSLRLLSAHMLVNNTPSYQPEQLTDEALQKSSDPETVLAEYRFSNGTVVSRIRYCDVPKREVESFLEEVKHGTYPLTALRPTYNKPVVSRHRNSPELTDSIETFDEETRRILNLDCELLYCPNNAACTGMSLHMKMDDQMNRQINCDNQSLDPLAVTKLVEELVRFGLIHYDDRDIVKNAINHKLERSSEGTGSVSAS